MTDYVDVDLCTEKWQLSPTAIACVELIGKVLRRRNTGDVIDDIILDYSNEYSMFAKIGRIEDTDNSVKFVDQIVSFTDY